MENQNGPVNPLRRRLAVFVIACSMILLLLAGYALLGIRNNGAKQPLDKIIADQGGDCPAKALIDRPDANSTDLSAKKADYESKADLPAVNTIDSVTEDQQRQLIDESTKELTGEAKLQEEALAVKARTPLIKWQKERVENIKREDIRRVIANLANFDDNHFAMTVDGSGYKQGWPRDEMIRIIHLSRVGRLMAEGRNAPALVVPLLKESLVQSLKGWPQAFEARRQQWAGGSFSLSGPEDYDKFSTRGLVATYLLGELGDYESLPLLMHSYKESEKWTIAYNYMLPVPHLVPPTITLYAMHQLVSKYPTEGLSEAAVKSRDAYMKWAEDNLAKPTVVSRSAWNAEYDTSDPMVRITDPKGILHKVQQKINLTVYPHRYKDGTWITGKVEDRYGERTQQWLDNIEPFVKAITPQSDY